MVGVRHEKAGGNVVRRDYPALARAAFGDVDAVAAFGKAGGDFGRRRLGDEIPPPGRAEGEVDLEVVGAVRRCDTCEDVVKGRLLGRRRGKVGEVRDGLVEGVGGHAGEDGTCERHLLKH